MERRGQKYHRERLSEALREEIETIVEGELGDPRIGLVNVSELHLAADSRSARVLVVVQGDDDEGRKHGRSPLQGRCHRGFGGLPAGAQTNSRKSCAPSEAVAKPARSLDLASTADVTVRWYRPCCLLES